MARKSGSSLHVVVLGALLAACAAPPGPAPVAATSPPCAFVRVEQAGRVVPAAAGTVTVARAPFSITYVGPGREPGLHIGSKPQLATWLAQQGRPEVWMPFGQGMAGSPGDPTVDDRIEVFRDDGQRRAVRQLVHDRYWPMVQAKADAANLDTGVRVGLNVWWDPPATGPRVYRIRAIDGVPVERTRHAALHVVAFGEMDRVVAERVSIPMLQRVRWNACTVRFQ